MINNELAILGGPAAVQCEAHDIFDWPIVTPEHEQAVLDVLRRGGMSGTDVTVQFEREFAAWQGCSFALGCNTGTASLHCAMFGSGIGVGDEIICPSLTFWASILQCYSLGATPVFAEIDPVSLCIDPSDIEHRITACTKAIMVVHYVGHPADMQPIMDIARRRGLRVIEDVSHAQGGLYRGQRLGTFGDVAAMSLMSGKSFAIGEAGMLVTDDLEIFERAVVFGHYERFDDRIHSEDLRPLIGLPLGGQKYRMHQMSSAVGRVQLKHYDGQCAEIRKAMNYFWDLLEGVPGIRAHRVSETTGSNMAGWYNPAGLYVPEEVGGLSVSRFAEAVRAEGAVCLPGVNKPLHLHPLFNSYDIYGHGKPTRTAHSQRDVRQPPGSLPVSEAANSRTYRIPWFKRFCPDIIAEHAAAYRKVALHHGDLLADDPGNPPELGGWHFVRHS
ncbi:MAG: DegT/DnrJ/EryC1/StrS family aminotransferase [Anaerolineae bacterium]|nr:DegT/DnrJ/EryC1/StrS family aminotransferase [Anaerolineae bacterium]